MAFFPSWLAALFLGGQHFHNEGDKCSLPLSPNLTIGFVDFYLRLAGQSEDMSVRPSVRSFVRPFGTVSKKGEFQFEGFPELLQMIKRNANLRDFPELLQFLYASTSS